VFLTYLYRELRRRHRQAILTGLGLALGICLVVTVSATASGVRDAQDQVLHSLYGVGTDITVTKNAVPGQGGPMQFGMNPGGQELQGERFSRVRVRSAMGLALVSQTKLDRIATLDGVASAVGSLKLTWVNVSGRFAQIQGGQTGGFAPPGSANQGSAAPSQAPIKIDMLSITGVDVADQTIGPLSSATITSGRTFSSSESDAKVIVVDSAYAKQQGLTVGDTKKIGGVKFTTIGISKSASADANVYTPLARAQKLAGESAKVNQIYVKASSATRIAAVKKEIKATLPGATVTTSADLADQVSGSLSSASTLANRLGKWLAVAALVAAIAVASLLTLSTVSRRVREFGTLKAIGWRSRRIVAQVVGEAFVIGVAGGAVGVALGYLVTWLIGTFSPSLEATVGRIGVPAQSGFAPGAPPGVVTEAGGPAAALRGLSQTVTVYLHAPISLQLLGAALGLAILGGLIAGAFGGWRAACLSPADALRRVD
jgi:ABC-type lipoprotein release transport system permease subunit